MRIAIVLLFAVSLSVAAPVPKEVKKSDAELLEGQWEVVMQDRGDGPKAPTGDVAKYLWVFKEGKLHVGKAGDEGPPRVLKLDPTASPKELDFGWGEAAMNPAIYKIDEDTLTICHGWHGQKRPTEFKGEGDGKRDCYVLKRVTNEKKAK